MEQNTPNGTGKGSWRDRLGIGAKEMPKISDDFKAAPKAAPAGGVKVAERPVGAAPKAPVVAKPAPMAPRPAPPTGERSVQSQVGKPAITPVNGPSLADRLKAQRDAAEKLAEQRVNAARDRIIDPPPARNGTAKAPPPAAPPPAPIAVAPKPAAAPGAKPKFSFAEEDPGPAKAEPAAPVPPRDYKPQFQAKAPAPVITPPPIVPPRPSLGGDRPMTPPPAIVAPPSFEQRPRAAAPPPSYPPPSYAPPGPSAGYRPLDPPPGAQGYGARPAAPAMPPPRAYPPASPAGYSDPQLQARRDAYEQYRRTPAMDAPHAADEFRDEVPPPRRAVKPLAAPRGRVQYEDELGDVFEDDAPPPPQRRRASAKDYRQAYDDYDAGHEEEGARRSTGPWIILLSMLAVAALLAGGWWVWSNKMPSSASVVPAGEVPVVKAPEAPAKTEPEPLPTATGGGTEIAPASQSKQIYDRILGEQSLEGNKIVPTEEAPVAPATTGETQTAPAAPAAEAIPMPAGAGETETKPAASGAVDETAPLPIPPPPGDTSGALTPPASGQTQTQTVAMAAPEVPGLPQPAGTSEISSNAAEISGKEAAIPEPPPLVSSSLTSDTAAVETQAPPPAVEAPAEVSAPAATEVVRKPAKKIETAAKIKARQKITPPRRKKIRASEQQVALGSEPVVLVPPAGNTSADVAAANTNLDSSVDEAAPAPKRSGSFFDLFKRDSASTSSDNNGTETAFQKLRREKSGDITRNTSSDKEPTALTPDTETASLEPDVSAPAAKPKTPAGAAPAAAASGGGYVIQLGSFRSEAEALAETDRIRSRHGGIVSNLPVRISQGTVAGSTRYRAGIGPAASREAANKVCASLFAKGERDCLVVRR